MLFIDAEHKQRFSQRYYGSKNRTNEYVAAVYLLTSDENLWLRTLACFFDDEIDFSMAILKDIKAPEYVLYSAAKDLFTESDKLAYSDLFDRRIVTEKTLELLINALRIKRFGFKWCVAAEG